jgi:hypothetical protein
LLEQQQINGTFVGRLSKATFIRIYIHLYSSNVVTRIQTQLDNKQQNILNLCLLLSYIIVRRVYSVLGVGDPPIRVELRSSIHAAYRQQNPLFSKRSKRFFKSEQTVFLKTNKPFF